MQSLKKFYFGKRKYTPFVSTWKTDNLSSGSSTATQVKLPLISTGSYNFVVEWGDGTQSTITAWNQAQVTKTYSVAGTYQITIKGKCIGWVFNNTGDRLKILSVQQWGSFNLGTNQGAYFSGCANLNLSGVTDLLNLKTTTSLYAIFSGCSSLTTIGRLSEWDVSAIVTMAHAFFQCTLFNQDISTWNTSSVTDMSRMFQLNLAFNQNIGSWNVSNVTSFSHMFNTATAFNNGGNSSINNWQIKTTGSVNFINMFWDATSFNQPIDSWNTIAVTNMSGMFKRSISGTNLFNQPLNSWNTSNVTDMNVMFHAANGTTSFNQNIGSWNISNVGNFTNFMAGKTPATFSATNLDEIYNGWSSRPVKTPITISFGTAKYTAAGAAGRAILTGAPNNWAITDGGI